MRQTSGNRPVPSCDRSRHGRRATGTVRGILAALAIACGTIVGFADSAVAQSLAPAGPAQIDLNPQIEIRGSGLATDESFFRNNSNTGNVIDFSDSALTITGRQALFSDQGIGSFTVGALAPTAGNGGIGNPLFVDQAFVDYQTKCFEVYAGRTSNPVDQLVSFPVLRDEDLLTYTNMLDAFSSGANGEEQRFSNVAALVLNQNLTWYENFHAQYLINSQVPTADADLNSYGVTIQYLSPPGKESLQLISSLAFAYEYEALYNTLTPSGINLGAAAGTVNLNQSLTDKVDLTFQDVLTSGNNTASFGSLNDSYVADGNALAVSARYLHSPFGSPGYQLSLTAGSKTYRNVINSNSTEWVLTFVKRLGLGFDGIAQYSYQWRNSALAQVYGNIPQEQLFTVGLAFNFLSTINQHVNPIRSILNYGHEYVPN